MGGNATASRLSVAALTVFLSGCGFGASQEWSLRHPEEGARTTRFVAGNALVTHGPLVGGEMLVTENEGEVAVKSGGVEAGYGAENMVPNRCVEVGAHILGRLSGGKPALLDEDAVHFGFGTRGELTLAPARDLYNEKYTLLYVRPELVALLDATIWTIGSDRAVDLSGGVGFRLSFVSKAGPPIARWLGALL